MDDLLPDESGEEDVAGAESGEDKSVDEQRQLPAVALPGHRGVPDDKACHGGDIAIALRTGGEQGDEHGDGGEHGIAESLMTVLAEAAIGREEQQNTWNDEPQVAIFHVAGDLAGHA